MLVQIGRRAYSSRGRVYRTILGPNRGLGRPLVETLRIYIYILLHFNLVTIRRVNTT